MVVKFFEFILILDIKIELSYFPFQLVLANLSIIDAMFRNGVLQIILGLYNTRTWDILNNPDLIDLLVSLLSTGFEVREFSI